MTDVTGDSVGSKNMESFSSMKSKKAAVEMEFLFHLKHVNKLPMIW